MEKIRVSQEVLVHMANVLKKAAEDIMTLKSQMDSALIDFLWEDPTGVRFKTIKYPEGFKPLQSELIPQLDDFIKHLAQLDAHVSGYAGTAAIVGAGVVLAGSEQIKGFDTESGLNIEQQRKNKILKDNIISGDNEIDMPDDYERLKNTDAYRKSYNAYLEELNTRNPDLSKGISTREIDEINSTVLGLKDDELRVRMTPLLNDNYAGEHEPMTNEAKINWNYIVGNKSSRCEVGAIGAHEATHVRQDVEMASVSVDDESIPLKRRQHVIDLLEAAKEYDTLKVGTRAYYDNLLEEEARIREYAFRDACNTYAENKYYPQKYLNYFKDL